MTYSIILLVPRKPSLSLEAFKHHWETTHVPLLKNLVGYDFPLSHTRHYIESSPGNPNQVNVSIGSQETMGYDGLAVLTFANREHRARFMAKLEHWEKERLHREDLEQFVDVRGLKGIMVGETMSTGRDGGMVGWSFVGSV